MTFFGFSIHELRPYFEAITAASALFSAVAWLVALLIFAVTWRSARPLLDSAREIRVSGWGFEATIQRGFEAAAAIGAATARRAESSGTTSTELHTEELARVVESAIAPRRSRALLGKSVLWVDDRPTNNTFESKALRALGLQIATALDTEPALGLLAQRNYDLVISDMGRPSGQQAGYVLLSALREKGDQTPFIIYAGSNAPQHKEEARRRGAQGTTNDPRELLELVLAALTADSR